MFQPRLILNGQRYQTMWREADLKFSANVTGATCAIVPAHPWVYGLGKETDNGAYLSPVNAVHYLAKKLASVARDQQVVIFMITGNNHDEFMQRIGGMASVFPAPAFTQVQRLAQSAIQLATAKMQIPAAAGDMLPVSMPLSVPTTRAAVTAKLLADAQHAAGSGIGIDGMKSALTAFSRQRDNLLTAAVAGLDELQGRSARSWVFTGNGNIATTLFELVKNIPHPAAPLSTAMMMVGDDLAGIAGMINEIKSNAGT